MLGVDARAFRAAWTVFLLALGVFEIYQVRRTILIFIVALLLGLVWIWLKGGLEWGPSSGRNAAFGQARRKSS